MTSRTACSLALVLSFTVVPAVRGDEIALNEQDCFEARGLSVLLYHNAARGVLFDQKLAGLEIILHGERIATNGDLRLLPTPEQWDTVPRFKGRKREALPDRLVASCEYPDLDLAYHMEVLSEGDGLRVAVHLDRPLPEALVGRAGFNLEFLPPAYFGKSFAMDERLQIFPRHPRGPMHTENDGTTQPLPLARGRRIVLSPEEPLTRVSIASETGELLLLDGRNKAQNGWFVVREAIAPERTSDAVVWHVRPNLVPGWMRRPVVAHNQAGYTPGRSKVAVLELDPLFEAPETARLLRIMPNGKLVEVFRAPIKPWGRWMRYEYSHFDFSSVMAPGLYVIEYADDLTAPFPIGPDVYRQGVWQPTLDTFLPVQMDHVQVQEAYRVWHGASHLDDARQAPTDQAHFNGYAMPSTTDSRYAPGEHIPGLDRGGWYDSGHFNIRTQSQANVILNLVRAREYFGLEWDETTIDQAARLVEIRRPDGVSDALQQIEHGVIGLLAQYDAFGHAIPGITAPTRGQYTHSGDGASMTDNRVYSAALGALEADGDRSGIPDDRWAFTTRTTALQYITSAALAAASRALRGYDDALAERCLETAVRAWTEEQSREPVVFRAFNTTGGDPDLQELRATVELVLATKGGETYRKRLGELLPTMRRSPEWLVGFAVHALPYMDTGFRDELTSMVREAIPEMEKRLAENPFGVPISRIAWGGSGTAAGFAVQMFFLNRAFPELVGPEPTLRGFDYMLGTHPTSAISYVSGVGAQSVLVAYGMNRADDSFIPGGMVPGVVIVQPDFPELKEDWPFLWFESEYVVTNGSVFVLAANAAKSLAR